MSKLRIFDSGMKNVSAKGLIVVFRIVSVSVDCGVFRPENKVQFLTVRRKRHVQAGAWKCGFFLIANRELNVEAFFELKKSSLKFFDSVQTEKKQLGYKPENVFFYFET